MPFFNVVIGGDTTATRKPEPESLNAVMAALGTEASQSLMVGDSKADLALPATPDVPSCWWIGAIPRLMSTGLGLMFTFHPIAILIKPWGLLKAALHGRDLVLAIFIPYLLINQTDETEEKQMFSMFTKKLEMPAPENALPGRDAPILNPQPHAVTGNPIVPPFPEGMQRILLGMGCFWGAERLFWQTKGVWTTSVGYAGGYTKNASYREVCSGETGHTEVVEVVFDPDVIDLNGILKIFWENHNPTQGMRQGNDIGTQYRSAIYADDAAMLAEAEASFKAYQAALSAQGMPPITTELALADEYYLAEDDHQQYLYKNPNGYCGIRGTGVSCPI